VVERQLSLQITIKNKFIKEFSSFRKFTIYFEYAKERFLTFNYLILPPSLAKYISHPIGRENFDCEFPLIPEDE